MDAVLHHGGVTLETASCEWRYADGRIDEER
jgi:hypothetical protein